jgi:hypothetical protein
MNIQLIANVENEDRAQCGKNEAGGMVSFVVGRENMWVTAPPRIDPMTPSTVVQKMVMCGMEKSAQERKGRKESGCSVRSRKTIRDAKHANDGAWVMEMGNGDESFGPSEGKRQDGTTALHR